MSDVLLAPVAGDPHLLGCTSEADLLVEALARHPARLAMRGSGEDLSYADLAARISRYSQALAAAGLGAGSRIGLLAGNRAEVVFCNYALLLLGCCLVPLHPRGSADDHVYVAKDAELHALIFDADQYEERAGMLAPHIPRLIALGSSALADDLTQSALGHMPVPLVAPVLHPDQIVRISYSGGTTSPRASSARPARC
jgi:fatty-acyl-CoA synthase